MSKFVILIKNIRYKKVFNASLSLFSVLCSNEYVLFGSSSIKILLSNPNILSKTRYNDSYRRGKINKIRRYRTL